MNIQSTRLHSNTFQRPAIEQTSGENDTFFIDLDPFSGVKRFVGDAVEIGASFGLGALPGVGIQHHGEMAIMGGFNGRNNTDTRWAVGGAGLNAAGSLGLVVAGGQYLMGGDPSMALGISAAALAGSGAISVALMH